MIVIAAVRISGVEQHPVAIENEALDPVQTVRPHERIDRYHVPPHSFPAVPNISMASSRIRYLWILPLMERGHFSKKSIVPVI
jgi:hypothetical protein